MDLFLNELTIHLMPMIFSKMLFCAFINVSPLLEITIDWCRGCFRLPEMPSLTTIDLLLDEGSFSDNSITFNRELATCLLPMLEKLPEAYREVLELVEIQGVSQRVGAETLGISISGTKSRVQRGRQKLKAMLLACCQVRLDSMGNILEYKSDNTKCNSEEKSKKTSCC
jgi:RNA polymerase sigma-70 factor, ECF subfamily